MVAAPDIQEEDDGTIQQVSVNLSDTEFVPGSLSQAVSKHHSVACYQGSSIDY